MSAKGQQRRFRRVIRYDLGRCQLVLQRSLLRLAMGNRRTLSARQIENAALLPINHKAEENGHPGNVKKLTPI
jgi:hypothetical protein